VRAEATAKAEGATGNPWKTNQEEMESSVTVASALPDREEALASAKASLKRSVDSASLAERPSD